MTTQAAKPERMSAAAKRRIEELEAENYDLASKIDTIDIRLEIAKLAVGVIQASPGRDIGQRFVSLCAIVEGWIFHGVPGAQEVLKPVPDDVRIN